jgi:hypothetical protein
MAARQSNLIYILARTKAALGGQHNPVGHGEFPASVHEIDRR